MASQLSEGMFHLEVVRSIVSRKRLVCEALQFPVDLEVEEALAKDPTNGALKREFKEPKKYHEFLKEDSERMLRHEMLQLSRRALEPKPSKRNKAKRGPKA